MSTIESGQTLTLDNDTVTGTTFTDTDASSIIQIDGNTTLTLDGATINGGTINDYSTDPSGSIIAGGIDVTGDSTISGASLNNGNVTIESGVILTLDNDTVTGTTFTGTDASSILQIDATTTLKLDGATIDGGAVHDAGTIDVTGASAINGNLTLAGGEIRVEDNATLTLGSALAIGANTVTLAGSHAVLDDFAGLSLAGGTIAGSGHLAADTNLTGYGTVSISLDVADLVTASGGTLEFTNAVDGTSATSFEIAAAANSVLKFDAAVGTAAVHPTVTFEGSDNGLGVLDLTAIALSDFHGVIANFDEGEAIDVHYAASASLDNTGHVLTVFDSLGNSLGTIDFATSYAGDTFNVSSGAITVDDLAITLDSASATEGAAIHVIGVTDEGANVASDVTYSWQTQNNDNQWNEIGSGSSYTPTETDEGHSLRLVTTYAADSSGSESTTVGFGTVQESPTENASIVLSGLTGGNAVEGQQITAVVNEGDAAGVSDITYTFQTSTDNGVTWTPAQSGPGNTYTPTETDEGSQLQVQVSFTDSHGFAETGATSAGTVQESVTDDLVATLDSTSATEGTPINVTGVTDGGLAVASGIAYDWLVSNDNGATWAEANGVNGGSSYTPVAADDGQLLHLTVSLANDPTGTESSIYDLGTVQAAASGQPPVVTTSATINFDDALAGTDGAALDNYLAGYGISLEFERLRRVPSIEDDRQIYGGGIVNATTGHNVLGESGGYPANYTVTFAHSLTSFSFDRAQENAGSSGSSYPQWTATAYDAAGNVLATVGEGEHIVVQERPLAAAHYVLSGPGIDHITFTGNDQGHDGFANVLTDTWVLDGTNIAAAIAPDNLQHFVFPNLTISDTGPTIQSATVTSTGTAGGNIAFEGLTFTGNVTEGITVTTNGNGFDLSGSATLAAYQDVLSHLTFSTWETQSPTFTVTVNDGTASSAPVISDRQCRGAGDMGCLDRGRPQRQLVQWRELELRLAAGRVRYRLYRRRQPSRAPHHHRRSFRRWQRSVRCPAACSQRHDPRHRRGRLEHVRRHRYRELRRQLQRRPAERRHDRRPGRDARNLGPCRKHRNYPNRVRCNAGSRC